MVGNEFYDKQFSLVDCDIRRMKKGDGRAYRIGKKRLDKISKHLEIDKLIIGIREAMKLKEFTDRRIPIFRTSYGYEFWAESLMKKISSNYVPAYS